MTAQPHPWRSPRPVCPDIECGKVWAPTKKDAARIRAEIIAETGHSAPIRYYQCSGGWHWTRQVTKTNTSRANG